MNAVRDSKRLSQLSRAIKWSIPRLRKFIGMRFPLFLLVRNVKRERLASCWLCIYVNACVTVCLQCGKKYIWFPVNYRNEFVYWFDFFFFLFFLPSASTSISHRCCYCLPFSFRDQLEFVYENYFLSFFPSIFEFMMISAISCLCLFSPSLLLPLCIPTPSTQKKNHRRNTMKKLVIIAQCEEKTCL